MYLNVVVLTRYSVLILKFVSTTWNKKYIRINQNKYIICSTNK